MKGMGGYAGGPPQLPQHRAGQYGQHGQHLPPRYQMPQDPRFQNPGGQYRLPQPSPQVQMQQQQQQLLQRQRALQQQQQQQQQAMLPNEAMGLQPGLQPRQQERWTSYEQHMALLQLQQQQQSSYDASEAVQLAELQQGGVPLTSLGSLSNDALMSLQALVRPHFPPGCQM